MAEIEMERRPRRSPWTWIALLLVLIGVAVGAWLVFGGGDLESERTPVTEMVEPLTEPGTERETAPAEIDIDVEDADAPATTPRATSDSS